MKRKIRSWKKRIMALMIALFMALSAVMVTDVRGGVQASDYSEKRACWIAYLDIQKYLRDKSESDFRRLFTNMCNNVISNNMNTVIVQVRPMSDAIYPSAYFPWSEYINSNGQNPGYDPLKIMIEIAHSKGLKIEAWINPYRVSNSTSHTNAVKNTEFYNAHSGYMIEYTSGEHICLALDPSRQEARNLIINGVKEIVSNYSVDGIHLDDYFYVTGMSDLDVASKKANVNALVKELYSSIKSIKPSVEFGISPAGNLENARSAGADVDTWMSQSGYIDYIMPQIYWTDNYLSGGQYTTLFTNRANEWAGLNKSGVKMYVGLALYRVGENSETDKGWSQQSTNLMQQYITAKSLGYSGYALFRYVWLDEDKAKTELANLNNVVSSLQPTVNYTTHIQNIGWAQTVKDGEVSGTSGQSKRLEGIKINLNNISGGVTYRTHVQTYGWQDWVSDGEISGTSGQSKRLEAIEIKLTGEAEKRYDIYYRVHAQTYGWLGWAKNGETAGTSGLSRRLEAIQIVLVLKGGTVPGDTSKPYIKYDVRYTTHVQTYGWQDEVYDGQSSGTVGSSKRLEAITIRNTSGISGSIQYRTHVQTYGWQGWVSDGAVSGTSGQSKRLEAIEIKLTGALADTYDVYYRVHCQTYGWLGWAKNGESAGTSGLSRRMEAIQIVFVPKGGAAPGSTANHYIQN